MKILISTDFYTNNLGGVTTSVLALSRGLRNLGHQIRILTLSTNNKSSKDGDEYYIRSFPAYYSPGVRFSAAINDPLLKELIEWHPDIIHVQSEGSALTFASKIQKKCNVPLIITCHTDYAYFVFGKLRNIPVIEAIEIISSWLVYHSIHTIVVPSKKATNFPFLKPFKDRLRILPNGIELQKLNHSLSEEKRLSLLKDLKIRSGSRLLVSITRLSREKNIQEIIEYLPALLEKVPEAVLLIVGDGPYANKLKELARKLDLQDHVVFAGRKSNKEIFSYYLLSDVFVSASTFEVHSMSYLEALGEGLPLLCRNDEALDGVLEDGVNGFTYDTKEEFVEHACKLLKDDSLLSKMGDASLKKAEDYSCENFASSALKIYEDVITSYRNEGH
ncbi:MAG: glycosyltransferase [Erysipelotrichaceae bacterium]|nr:glycosyltransferase [Erysipelotrichaceae bacterium]